MLVLSRTGCHAGGGNVVQAGATLRTGDLQKNGMLDPEALYKPDLQGQGKDARIRHQLRAEGVHISSADAHAPLGS